MIPFVSVIIPVYNAEKYLRACLDSVVGQSLRELEIICVDDGSTDASPALLAEYAARDPRVRVITQENAGVGPARNVGIRAARGEFVAFLDPDDLLPDSKTYENLYLWAKENRVRVCGGAVCSLANDGKRYFPDASWGSNADQAFPRDGLMRFAEWQFDYGFYRYIFERELLLDNEIFFPPYIRYQDPIFCARALEAADTFYALRRSTYVFRDWHTPDYTDPRRVYDQLRGIRDLLKFSRERGYAKLHWLQIHRLFEKFKPHVLALAEKEKTEPTPENSARALLKEIDAVADIRLARRYKPDTPYYSADAEFLHPEIKVSVIIPVYNVEKYLRQCLDSVVSQSLKEIEIICINDGSPDNSLAILREYEERDSRFVIIDQENQGVGRSRNTGIRKARGEFVCFMDPDDWYPEADILETLYSTAKRERVCICGGSLEEHKPDGTIVRDFNPNAANWGGKFSRDEIMRFRDYQYDWGYQRFVFSRKFLVENDIFFPPYIRFQDPPFFVKAMVLAEKFYSLRKITYAYRVAYKEPIFSNPRKLFDMFLGVEDVLLLAKNHGLEKLVSRILHLRFGGWAFSQMMPTLIKNPKIAQKAKEIFILFPPEIAVAAGSEWWNFLERDVKSPLISVVVPVYNVEKYLRECLDSVCNQTLKNIEIICVNDGSTDSSFAILEEYAAKDSRITLISQINKGLGAARNVGLDAARGKYVYFMDSDDVSPQNALAKIFAQMKTFNLDVLYFGARAFFETAALEKRHVNYKTFYNREKFDVTSGQNLAIEFSKTKSNFPQSACCCCFNREFLVGNNIRFPESCLYEDNAFFWTVLKNALRAKSISETLFLRRVRQGSIMTNRHIGFHNCEGYAKTIMLLERLSLHGRVLLPEFFKILEATANRFSRQVCNFYRESSSSDRERVHKLLEDELKTSAWLNSVREGIVEIDTKELASPKEIPTKQNSFQKKLHEDLPKTENPKQVVHVASAPTVPAKKKIYPVFLARLGALFILNKAVRKRWRERHMDLAPKDGIDVNAHPELRRDSALKRFAVRAASLFIFSKKKRKAFRARHLNLTPKDGVDVRALSSKELARLREAKRSKSVLWRTFDALVPVTRGKIVHTERHLRRSAEEQTRILLDELRRVNEENRRAFEENRRALNAVRADLKTARERTEALSHELAASKTELKNQALSTERVLRAALSETREMLMLKALAAKHAVLDAEKNLRTQFDERFEMLSEEGRAARREAAQSAEALSCAVNARADALSRVFEEALAREAASVKSELLSSEGNLQKQFGEGFEHVSKTMHAVKSELLSSEENLQKQFGEGFEHVSKTMHAVKSELCASAASTEKHLRDALVQTGEALTREQEKSAAQTNAALAVLAKSVPESEKRVVEVVEKQKQVTEKIGKVAEDLVWTGVFNSTISGSAWLRDTAFSPGRWAVGYPFLYVLYRVLNDGRPCSILETGLGQSTRMIAQYAAAHAGTEHTVVEHDTAWIRFFGESFARPPSTQVAQLKLTKTWRYGEDSEIVAYEGFGERFRGRKFDLISLDGPFGFMAKIYARADILPLVPECLSESFVILIDDFERKGEQATVAELTRILRERGIAFCEATYSGIKQMHIIASPDKKFLCSL